MNRPDAMILSYPVITMTELGDEGSTKNLVGAPLEAALVEEMSLEKQVSVQTPPAFIWHTVDDELVPVENSMLFAATLRKNKIPFELHLFSKGLHGLSLADKESFADDMHPEPHVAHWFDLCLEWLGTVYSNQ
jgi:dipeptidyl aminopeptidase/acylaminoacyl peptidase